VILASLTYVFFLFFFFKGVQYSFDLSVLGTRVESVKFIDPKVVFRCRVYNYELDEPASCGR